jgi:hypothetical protein
MRGRRAGSIHQHIQFVEIALCEVARTLRIRVGHRHRNDATLLVVHNRSVLREILRRVDPITLVICLLQSISIDQVASHGSAAKQIDEQRAGPVRAKKGCSERAEAVKSAETAARQCREHRRT